MDRDETRREKTMAVSFVTLQSITTFMDIEPSTSFRIPVEAKFIYVYERL